MAGRKRKIPTGYIPQWHSDSENSDISGSDWDQFFESKRRRTSSIHYVSKVVPPEASVAGAHEAEAPDRAPLPGEVSQERSNFPLVLSAAEGPPISTQLQGESGDNRPQTHLEQEFDNDEFYIHNVVVQHNREDEEQQQPDHQHQENLHQESDEPLMDDNEEYVNNLEPTPLLHTTPDNLNLMDQDTDGEGPDDEIDIEELNDIFSDYSDHENEDKESYQYILRKFSEDWIMNETDHNVSKTGSSEFWNITRKWMFALTSAFHKENKKKFPKFDHIRRKLKKEYVPRVSLDTGFVHKDTNAVTVVRDTEKVPVADFPPDQFQKVFEIAHVKV